MSSLLVDLLPHSIATYHVALLAAIAVSLKFLALAAGTGFAGGIVLAFAQLSRRPYLSTPAIALVEAIRNTPLLVQLFWIHFALPALTGMSSTAQRSAAIGISLCAACYFSEIIRAGLQGVARGQWEAAAALGLSSWSTRLRIILPQAVIDTLPATANTVLSFFKATSILSVIAVPELMMTANRVSARTGETITVLTTALLLYVAVGATLTLLLGRLEAAVRKRSMR